MPEKEKSKKKKIVETKFFDHCKINKFSDGGASEKCFFIGCDNPRYEAGICEACAQELLADKTGLNGLKPDNGLLKKIKKLKIILKDYQAKRSKISTRQISSIIRASKELAQKK